MANWMKPTDKALDNVEAGDRVLVIVMERPPHRQTALPVPRIVILEATEDGWFSADDTYAGYTPDDGVLWTTEKSACEIVNIIPRTW